MDKGFQIQAVWIAHCVCKNLQKRRKDNQKRKTDKKYAANQFLHMTNLFLILLTV
jgi:hypothetical protein